MRIHYGLNDRALSQEELAACVTAAALLIGPGVQRDLDRLAEELATLALKIADALK